MTDEKGSAKAEAQAMPASHPGFFSRAEKVAEADASRVLTAIENWYAQHFHKATVAGRPALPAEEKAALVQAVTAAIQPKE